MTAIYEGTVFHRRRKVEGFSPAENAFKYPVFMCLVDLADLPNQNGGAKEDVFRKHHPLWSLGGGRNLCAFHREDYFGDPALPLDECVRRVVEEQTGSRPHGPIRVLCNIRNFGYVFNPVCIYYCFDPEDEHLEAVLLEVSNTPWLEKRLYVLRNPSGKCPRGEETPLGTLRWRKDFHVSPFQTLDQDYEWNFISNPSGVGNKKPTKNRQRIFLTATSYRSSPNQREAEEEERRRRGIDADHTTGKAATRFVPKKNARGSRRDSLKRQDTHHHNDYNGDEIDQVKTFEVVLSLRRRELSFWSLSWAMCRYPMMTGVAQLYIHWQAAKVAWKGVAYVTPPKESPRLGFGALLFHLALFAVATVFWLVGALVGALQRNICRSQSHISHEWALERSHDE